MVFPQDLPGPSTDVFIMAAFPVYLSATAATHKTVKIVIYVIRDKVFYLIPVSYRTQYFVTDSTPFRQIRTMEIQDVFHLQKLVDDVV
jgi:hypothetical protein